MLRLSFRNFWFLKLFALFTLSHCDTSEVQELGTVKRGTVEADDQIWTELYSHDVQLNDLWSRYEWLSHGHDVMNTSLNAVFEALRRFDLSMTQILEIQRRQDREILELQQQVRRPAPSLGREGKKNYASLLKTGGSDVSVDSVQHDAPMTSACCDEHLLEERVERLTTVQLKTPLLFMRMLGENVASLNATVTSLGAKLTEQIEYVNVLAMEMERLKDVCYRSRRRVRVLTSRAESMEQKMLRLLSVEERLERVEEALHVELDTYDD